MRRKEVLPEKPMNRKIEEEGEAVEDENTLSLAEKLCILLENVYFCRLYE